MKTREQYRSGEFPIDSLTLEHKLDRIAKLVSRKASFWQAASFLAQHFNRADMKTIYRLLDDIEEFAYEHIVRWGDAYEAIEKVRLKARGGP